MNKLEKTILLETDLHKYYHNMDILNYSVAVRNYAALLQTPDIAFVLLDAYKLKKYVERK